jgi:regulator of sigma E protease
MTIIIFILILSFLVLIHELGHFLTAKKFGIKVEEFGMGYPPKALTLHKDKGGTEYTLNWLPFGGFVRMFGEDGSLASEGKGTQGKAFFDKPVWQRMIVIVAGVTVNFIFGVIAFATIYTIMGIPTMIDGVKINQVATGSPAEIAGLQNGDIITQIQAEDLQFPVQDSAGFIAAAQQLAGETALVQFERGDQVQTTEVYVRTKEEVPADQGSIGVVINDFELKRYPTWQMPFRGAVVGLQSAVEFGVLLLKSLGTMVANIFTQGKLPVEVAGPVGIVHMAQKEGILTSGWLDRLNFAAILSINLAIINLIPFPALDGGRFIFLIYEGIRRKRINPKIEHYANFAGFLLLISMIVAVSARDISRVAQDVNVQNWFRNLLP